MSILITTDVNWSNWSWNAVRSLVTPVFSKHLVESHIGDISCEVRIMRFQGWLRKQMEAKNSGSQCCEYRRRGIEGEEVYERDNTQLADHKTKTAFNRWWPPIVMECWYANWRLLQGSATEAKKCVKQSNNVKHRAGQIEWKPVSKNLERTTTATSSYCQPLKRDQ